MNKKKEWAPTPTKQGKYINYQIQLILMYNLYKYRDKFTEKDRRLFDGYYRQTHGAMAELYENDKSKKEIMDGLCANDIKELLKFYEDAGWQKPLK